MSDLQGLINAFTAPARVAHRRVAAVVDSVRRQAPGARMVGEFAVKIGLKEIGRRIQGGKDEA